MVDDPLKSLSQRKHHPDSHALDDWFLYGPKDPEIAQLVHRLAYERGLSLVAIEHIIKQALQNRIAELDQ
jgi:hypothetical protein